MTNQLRTLLLFSLLLLPGEVSAQRWDAFQRNHCTAMELRQYSAVLWDIPFGQSWERACERMPADINGYHFDRPTRCVNKGGHMWGEFDVPDVQCPHWGPFQRDGCFGFGTRQYSAVLHEVPDGISWENACAMKAATVSGQLFARPNRCRNTIVAMWGEFDVNDPGCLPTWGAFQRDSCTQSGKRQFSAILHNIPPGVSWQDACERMPGLVQGTSFSAPTRCKNTGVAMWGEFDVNDTTCLPPSWGTFRQDHCTAPGKRQYSAVLHNIPPGASWEDTCAGTAATVNNQLFAAPTRCKNAGAAMWGEFDVDDATCSIPSWGSFQRDSCTAPGKRQYSAILHNIPSGASWERTCEQTAATVEGTHFPTPSRCRNTGTAIWGEFDVPDAACSPPSWGRWGRFRADHCTAVGKRQYSAILHDIPSGVQWETACSQSSAEVEGEHFASPSRCVNAGLAMWGEFDINDATCNAQFWGELKKDHCTDSGRRQFSAVLHNVPASVKIEEACAATPAVVRGVSYARPVRCIKLPRPTGPPTNVPDVMWGEFEVYDPTCNPVTECTDPEPPPGAFPKTGNDGSVSCDAYCANAGGAWGPRGACAKGIIVSGSNQGSCLRCIDVGSDLGATDVTCFCKQPLTGFADTHNHQFANLGFGGQAIWGKPFGPIETALPWCTPVHGPGGLGDLMFDFVRNKFWPPWRWPSIGHLVGGYPQFDGWPRFTNTSHQVVHEDWLFRAYQGGLRLIVMFAVNNEDACWWVNQAPGRTCDDAEAIRHQLEVNTNGAKAMERYIDDKFGGPGRGWYRIVYSPEEARDAIAAGKLAVVLGVEVSFFLNCRTDADCTQDDVRRRVDEYYRMGVRHVYPIHFASNGFGGAALSNRITKGPSRSCASEGYEYKLESPLNPFAVPICSSRGLTDTGKFLIEELIRKKMIIDVDHMSVLARNDALTIAETHRYPVTSSHTGFIDVSLGDNRHEGNLKAHEVRRIRDLGGMVSVILSPGTRDTVTTFRGAATPVIDHQCGLTSQSFAQAYLYAVEQMAGAPVGLGSDFNAGPLPLGPRFGTPAALSPISLGACPGGGPTSRQTARVVYPFPVAITGSPALLDRSVAGQRVFDINEDGVAHVGMLPDLIEDLKRQGLTPKDLEPLLSSAEGYLAMWEKIARVPPR